MLIDAGMEAPLDSNPETFRQSLAADIALWAPVVKSARAEARLTVAKFNINASWGNAIRPTIPNDFAHRSNLMSPIIPK
jgi:hypothetical protein